MSIDPKTLSKFCILPWVSVQVNQDGAILPCCRTDEKYLYGQLDDSTTVREAWNSENTKKMRKAMLAGEDLPQCRDCLSCESKGAPSIRRDFNRRFAADFDRVARTKADGWFSYDEGLRHLGVRFSNVCNLRCRTCSPKNSTSWSADAKAAGIPTPPTTKLSPRPTFEEFAADLEPMIPTLKSVYFAGGEPLLADGHIRFLEMLLAAGRKDVALNYNTNFTELGLGSKSIFELWHEFDEIHVSASLDGVGRVAELVRKGCDWDSIVKNFYRLGFLPNVKFSIHCTISVLNCFHLPEAIDEWLRRKMIHTPGMLELNFVRDPEWYDIIEKQLCWTKGGRHKVTQKKLAEPKLDIKTRVGQSPDV
ncbi:MAG: twitch domain-containing radical SAM protein, partial [Bdellovibrionota bacterium]